MFRPLLLAALAWLVPVSAGAADDAAGASFVGDPITVHARHRPLREVLREIVGPRGMTLIIDRDAALRPVTIDATDTPWDEVVQRMLHDEGLAHDVSGASLVVAPRDVLEEARRRARGTCSHAWRLAGDPAHPSRIDLSVELVRVDGSGSGDILLSMSLVVGSEEERSFESLPPDNSGEPPVTIAVTRVPSPEGIAVRVTLQIAGGAPVVITRDASQSARALLRDDAGRELALILRGTLPVASEAGHDRHPAWWR